MSLEKKKVKVELLRVGAAKAELELKIEERLDEIERLKEHIKLSETKENDLNEKLKGMGD